MEKALYMAPFSIYYQPSAPFKNTLFKNSGTSQTIIPVADLFIDRGRVLNRIYVSLCLIIKA
jgi:hypothetical protein